MWIAVGVLVIVGLLAIWAAWVISEDDFDAG
jgi:hypothetical protein